jgi:hypothetical protein
MEAHSEAGSPESGSPGEPTLAMLLSQLFHDTETLLLQELSLFRAELGESAGHIISGGLLMAAGLLALHIGGLALIAALALLLGYVVPLWLACALVGLPVGAAGVALVLRGRHMVTSATLVPQRSVQAIRDTGDWLREELT